MSPKMISCVFILIISQVLIAAALSDGVVDLTAASFNERVQKSHNLWLVEFYAPWCGHCKALAPEYAKAAKALRGVVKVGAVDMDVEANKALGAQFGIKGFPTIKIFNGDKVQDYNGARTADALVDAVLAALKRKVKANMDGGSGSSSSGGGGDSTDSDVVELTDSNFDSLALNGAGMLVEFFAPWCGHCKNLAPHWARAAAELKGKMPLGALDATVHTNQAQKYQINGYPTIKFFPGNGQQPIEYDGGRTASDIVQWAMERANANLPPPALLQIGTQDTNSNAAALTKTCESQLCVIAVLPHIFDCQAKCRTAYLETLLRLGDKYKKMRWMWLWSEAGAQSDLEASLDIGGFGYPAMAVMNAKKMKYSLLRGAFSEQGIDEFLRDLSYGGGAARTAPVRGGQVPNIVQVEEWDGKDKEMIQETDDLDDIDLSDVDLDNVDDRDEL